LRAGEARTWDVQRMADLAGAHGHAGILLIGTEDLRLARILKMCDRIRLAWTAQTSHTTCCGVITALR
jgi:hypothetical protein